MHTHVHIPTITPNPNYFITFSQFCLGHCNWREGSHQENDQDLSQGDQRQESVQGDQTHEDGEPRKCESRIASSPGSLRVAGIFSHDLLNCTWAGTARKTVAFLCLLLFQCLVCGIMHMRKYTRPTAALK